MTLQDAIKRMFNLSDKDKGTIVDKVFADIDKTRLEIADGKHQFYYFYVSESIRHIFEQHAAYYASAYEPNVNRIYGMLIKYDDLPYDGFEIKKFTPDDIEWQLAEIDKLHQSELVQKQQEFDRQQHEAREQFQKELVMVQYDHAKRVQELKDTRDALKDES